MANWDITGSWIGEYSYHANESMPILPPNVTFTLAASQGWLGRFKGIVQDDTALGIPGEARIWGRIAGTSITFKKQYPVFYVPLDGQWVTLRNQMEQQHGIVLDRAVLPRPIRYRGEYDPVSGVIRGSWQIRSGRRFVRSGGRLLTLLSAGGTGDWEMKRQAG